MYMQGYITTYTVYVQGGNGAEYEVGKVIHKSNGWRFSPNMGNNKRGSYKGYPTASEALKSYPKFYIKNEELV